MSTRWKAFERTVAALIGGKRYWSNSGESLDCESENFVVQCKEVKALSLNALTELAEQVARDGMVKNKAGVVAIRGKRHHPRSPTLMVMTEEVWRFVHGEATRNE